jgi:carbonic anhydrase
MLHPSLACACSLAQSVALVVVVGHTGCAGVESCLHAAKTGTGLGFAEESPVTRWLTPLKALAQSVVQSDAGEGTERLLRKIVEANGRAQVRNVCHAEPIVRAWGKGRSVWVHGWVYEAGTGRLRDLGVSRGC